MRAVTWLGHSTTVLELGGARFVTDPVLRPRVAHLRRAWEADRTAIARVDAVLLSHLHLDHLDLPSLASLGRETVVVCPRGAEATLGRRGFHSLLPLSPGERAEVAGASVTATPAAHDGRRLGPASRRSDAIGFLVEAGGAVYFPGDTGLFDGMHRLHPALDLALVPIWGWGPKAGPGHLDPDGAAEALARLAPRLAVAIHWGTYYPAHRGRGRSPFLDTPGEEFLRAAAESAPGVTARLAAPNERIAF